MNAPVDTQKLLKQRTFVNADQKSVEWDGSPVQWRVSAYVLVVRDDEILIVNNSDEIMHDIPGGGIEFGEDIEQTLHREAREEAGAEIEIGELLHARNGFFYHRELDQFFQTLQLFYSAELVGELAKPTEERMVWSGFVPLDTVLDGYDFPPAVTQQIAQLRDAR
jgi:8-oxo-dGTP pyrophosphatase MutT (NUDIX family)